MNSTTLCDPQFADLLADFDYESLSNADETVYGVWPDFRIAFINRGWMRFAALNGGGPQIIKNWGLGMCAIEAIAAPLRPFFDTNFARCLREGRPWEHVYECSSATHLRKFHMLTFPLGRSEGLLIVNSLRQETAHLRTASPPIDEHYRNAHGHIVQCCHCRRVRRCGEVQTWDWVPDWVAAQPANTSHGLCEPCVGFHYSPGKSGNVGFATSFQTSS